MHSEGPGFRIFGNQFGMQRCAAPYTFVRPDHPPMLVQGTDDHEVRPTNSI